MVVCPMTPAQIKVQECLGDLKHMLSIPCPACSSLGDDSGCLPCYCFEDMASGARERLKEAKKARKSEKRAVSGIKDNA